MKLYESIKNNLKETDESRMTITQYATSILGGEIDMDTCDTEIDMLVALSFDFNQAQNGYYDKFIKLLCDKTKIEKVTKGEYPVLVGHYSDVFKPYNEECKDIFNMENSEFNEDEAWAEAVANLEPLISGNASDSVYKDMCDLLTGQYKIEKGSDLKEDDSISKRTTSLPEVQKYLFNKYRDEFDSINEVYDLTDYINRLFSEGGMKKVDEEFFLPGAPEEYKKDFKKLIHTIHVGN